MAIADGSTGTTARGLPVSVGEKGHVGGAGGEKADRVERPGERLHANGRTSGKLGL